MQQTEQPKSVASPPSSAPRDQIRRVGLTLLFTMIFMLRVPDVIMTPQFWAEDGKVFFRDNLCGGLTGIGKTYAGYYHLIPRLVALFAAAFRPLHAPAIYVGAALALAASVMYLVQSPRFPLPFAPLAALAIALAPDGVETFGNITNIQWILAMGAVAVVLMRPTQSPASVFMETAFVAAVGLTGPFVLFLFPVFVGKLLLEWNNNAARKRMLMLTSAAAIAGLVQAYALVNNPVVTAVDPNSPKGAGYVLLLGAVAIFTHTVGGLFDVINRALFSGSSWSLRTIAIFGMVEVALFLILVLSSIRSPQLRFERLALLYFGSVVLLATFYKFRDTMIMLTPQLNGNRYLLIPTIVACWLMVSAMREPRIGVLAKISVGALLLMALAGFSRDPLINYDWPSWARKLEAGSKPKIPINPESWFVETDCTVPQ